MQVTTVVSGLSLPWDLTWVGDLMLYDLRAGQVWSKRGSAAPRRVTISGFPSVFAQSEGGLLGLVADPAAATNSRFYTCQSVRDSGGNPLDVRVLRWRLTSDTTAVSDGAPVVTGIPLSSGRHSGCRLRFGADGFLYVGTGDAAVGTNPQNLSSLGGKVLRVRWDGTVPTDNPFFGRGGNARLVWTHGHRNVQGLALRPGTSELWAAEHGTDRDDEVNVVVKGGNYGWDPVPGYDESTPMTDLTKFPSAQRPMWSSGYPTVATSGAAFLSDARWGAWRGMLAVAKLKGQGVVLMRMNPTPGPSRVVETTTLPQAEGLGRIRTLVQGPDGALWLTTSNGSNDKIVRIAPTAKVAVRSAGAARAGLGGDAGAHRHRGERVRPQHRRRRAAAAQHRRRRHLGRAGRPRASPPPTPRRRRRRAPGAPTSSPAAPRARSCTRGSRAAPAAGRPTSAGGSSRSTPPRWATARSTSSRCGRAARGCASTGTGRGGACG